MDTVKDAGTSLIGSVQTASAIVKEKASKTHDCVANALYKIAERAQNNEKYRQSLDTIFTILQKHLLDAGATVTNFINDTTPEQHIPKAIDLFRTFLEHLAGTCLDPFIGKFKTTAASVMRDPELKKWFHDDINYLRRTLVDRDFASSDKSAEEHKQLCIRWRTAFMEQDDKWKNEMEALKNGWTNIEKGIRNDEDLARIKSSQQNFASDLKDGLETVAEEARQTGC